MLFRSQRGVPSRIRLNGRGLTPVAGIHFSSPEIHGRWLPEVTPGTWIEVEADPGLAPGRHELSVTGPGGESAKIAFYVDDVRQIQRQSGAIYLSRLPAAVWSRHDRPGEPDDCIFEAFAGQTLIFDVNSVSVGGRGNYALALLDANDRVVASNDGFDGSDDPFLAFDVPRTGYYRIRVTEETLQSGEDFTYRLTLGELPFVTGVFPRSVEVGSEGKLEVTGHNLPARLDARVPTVEPAAGLPVERIEHLRRRGALNVAVVPMAAVVEQEPNDSAQQGQPVPFPVEINGRIGSPGDGDFFTFEAHAGQELVVETSAARIGSPLDSRIEILTRDGKPIPQIGRAHV